jgi:hypothetical protein
MVESAVSIPDVERRLPSPDRPVSPSLKRRQSSEAPEPETSKRPRLDSVPTNGANHTSPPPSATKASPPRRKLTQPARGADEKSRNRRLFGGLLSTLSAPSNKPSSALKRRDEIEQRQRERLKRDDEEIVEARRKKREDLDRKRRVEQTRWDEQGTRIRHANMRATAGFLQTETQPRIYWKPWEMRKEDEERVRRQKEEVEESIRQELDDRRDAEGFGEVNGNAAQRESPAQPRDPDDDSAGEVAAETTTGDAAPEDSQAPGQAATVNGGNAQADTDDNKTVVQDAVEPEAENLDEKVDDDDHTGHEVLEGHDEDQVIY